MKTLKNFKIEFHSPVITEKDNRPCNLTIGNVEAKTLKEAIVKARDIFPLKKNKKSWVDNEDVIVRVKKHLYGEDLYIADKNGNIRKPGKSTFEKVD